MARTDSFKQQGLRARMVRELRTKGITDENVLSAMGTVPRHWFVDLALESRAYEDEALPILCDQTISQPSTVAFQSQLLEVRQDTKVLEIGTGSGYQTAVLCAMGAKVWSIERQRGLFDKTKRLLMEQHYPAKCFLGDGYRGLTEIDCGTFERIIITCGAPMIPIDLVNQLSVGGIMVIPVGAGAEQQMLKVTKHGEGPENCQVERYGDFKFVPMLEGKQF